MNRVLAVLQPISIGALLLTLVMLFGFQGEQIIAQPTVILLLAVPILIQVYFNSGLTYFLNRVSGEQHCVAGPSALIGASNFFELAVAAAIACSVSTPVPHWRRSSSSRRGAGHAVGCVDREPQQRLVRTRRRRPS
jgi:ACR3 family arsenite efflux pump ArsB